MRFLETHETTTGKGHESLHEIDYSVFEVEGRPRPLSFDPNRHKVLNSELKHLYTAVTRARVHVWIFDESEENRASMFEYFKARKLVQAVKDNETSGDLMFAEESSTDDWIHRGEEFMKKSLYDVAAKCFRLGNEPRMEKVAKSHQKAFLASRTQGSSALIKEMFLSAAHDFLECEVPLMAGRCLELAKEFSIAAKLYEKTNQLEKAAEIYKKMHLPVEGSRCLELAGKYKQAISLLCDAELFEFAIHCLNRFRIVKKTYESRNEPLPGRLLDNSPTAYQTEIQLSYRAAEFYHKHGKIDKMMSFLHQLPDLDDKIEFLTLRDRTEQAISIINSSGKGGSRRLVDFYMKQGMAEEALEIAENLGDGILRNRCQILKYNIKLSKVGDSEVMCDTEKNEICQRMKEVFYAMQDSKDKILAGKAAFTFGKVKNDQEFIQRAFGAFLNSEPNPSLAGQLECMNWMINKTDLNVRVNIAKCILGMETLFKALNILLKPINDTERVQLVEIFEYYGFHASIFDKTCLVYPLQKPMALSITKGLERTRHVCKVQSRKAKTDILKFLIENGKEWKNKLEKTLNIARCKVSTMFEEHLKAEMFIKMLENGIQTVELEMHIGVGSEEIGKRKMDLNLDFRGLEQISFEKCERLIMDIFPVDGISTLGQIEEKSRLSILETIRKPHNRFFCRSFTRYLQNLIGENRVDWMKYHVPRFLGYIFGYDFFEIRRFKNFRRALIDIEEGVIRDFTSSKLYNDDKTEVLENFGFEVSQNNKGKLLNVHSICNKMIASQELTRSGEPIEGLIQFCKFCDEVSQRNIDMDSGLSLFLYWIEFYVTISLLSISVLLTTPKDDGKEVCIPESFEHNAKALYFAFSKDALFPHICNKRLLKKYEKELLKTPACFSRLLCGTQGKQCLLDLIYLQRNDSRAKGIPFDELSQRILLLSLVVLCNLRGKVHAAMDTEKELVFKLCFAKWQKYTPEHVKNILRSLRNKKQPCPHYFQVALSNIVLQRKNDNLKVYTYKHSKSEFVEEPFDATKHKKNEFLSKKTVYIIWNPSSYFESQEDIDFRVIGDEKSECPNIPNRSCVSEEGSSISFKNYSISDHITVSDSEVLKEDENLRQERDSVQYVDSYDKNMDMAKLEHKRSEEDIATDVIIRFWKNVLFNNKVGGLCNNLRKQIISEKMLEIEKKFKSLESDDKMCNICGVALSSYERHEVILYERLESGENVISDKLPEDNNNDISEENNYSVDEGIKDNPFQLLLKGDNKRNIPNPENKDKHKASESHRRKLQEFESFKSKFCNEIYDTIHGIERFIEIYNLRDDDTIERYANMSYYIKKLCKESRQLEELVDKSISDRDWCNCDIDEKMESVCLTLSTIKDDVRKTALENKKRKQNTGSIETEEKGDNIQTKKKGRWKFKPTEKFTFSSM